MPEAAKPEFQDRGHVIQYDISNEGPTERKNTIFRPHNHGFASSRLCIHSLSKQAGAHSISIYSSKPIRSQELQSAEMAPTKKSKKGSDNVSAAPKPLNKNLSRAVN